MNLRSPASISIFGLLFALTATVAGCGPSQSQLQAEQAEAAALRAQTSAARAEQAAAKALDAAQKASVAADKAAKAVEDATEHLNRASDKLEQLQKMQANPGTSTKAAAAPEPSTPAGGSSKADPPSR